MSKKEDIKEEEINTTEEKPASRRKSRSCSRSCKDEPTSEELFKQKKISFYVFLPSLKITKKEQQRTNRAF